MKKTVCLLLLLTIFVLAGCDGSKPPVVTMHKPGDTGYISTIIPSSPEEKPETPTPVPSVKPEPSEKPSPSVKPSPAPTPTPPPTPSVKPLPPLEEPDFLTDQYFIYDVERKGFLKVSDAENIVYPASTTKLLTILYAKTLLPLDKVVTPGNELELMGEGSSIAYINKNHKLTVEQLIEGMLLPSGNDAALALAAAGGYALKPSARDGKQAVKVFMENMNVYAKKIGLVSSHFVNPDGYEAKDHYTSVEDMAIIARLAYEDETIKKYAKLPKDNVRYYSGHTNTWVNSNKCLHKDSPFYSPYVTGLKTGSLSKTYSCFLGSIEIDGQVFLCGFFGEKQSDDRFTDTLRCVEWLRKNVLL